MQFSELANVGMVLEDLNPFLVKRIQKVTQTFKNMFEDNSSPDMLYQFHRRIDGYDLDYLIPEDVKKDIEKEALRLIIAHEHTYQYFNRMYNFVTSISPKQVQFELERMWVNIQRKGEFLPVHEHSGIYSFVIWTDVPFNIEDEGLYSPNPTTQKNRAGHFQFLYIDVLGKISTLNLPVDRTWEGKMCIFPSAMNHQVYPFYSSDGIRISISGNFRVRIGD